MPFIIGNVFFTKTLYISFPFEKSFPLMFFAFINRTGALVMHINKDFFCKIYEKGDIIILIYLILS